MKRYLHLTIIAAVMLLGCTMTSEKASALVPMSQMRFHCADDTTKINTLLSKGRESGLKGANDLMSFYAHELLGTPYVGHTLEGDSEMLTINIDELDCTTFVETLYALTRTTLSGRFSWRDYAHHLENLRYRGGNMGDYSTRLHYICEWIIDNSTRGNLVDVTPDLPGVRYQVKTINYMSTHRDAYPSLADSAVFEKIRSFEIGFRNHRFPYIPKGSTGNKKFKSSVQSGDIIAMVTKTEGLDISHLGIIEKDASGEIYLLDASSVGKKVQIEDANMLRYLGRNSGNIGIRVFRVRE